MGNFSVLNFIFPNHKISKFERTKERKQTNKKSELMLSKYGLVWRSLCVVCLSMQNQNITFNIWLTID